MLRRVTLIVVDRGKKNFVIEYCLLGDGFPPLLFPNLLQFEFIDLKVAMLFKPLLLISLLMTFLGVAFLTGLNLLWILDGC